MEGKDEEKGGGVKGKKGVKYEQGKRMCEKEEEC